MKKVYCSQYKEFECCPTCHNDDSYFKCTHKSFEILHCCKTLELIKNDIDKHTEECYNKD